MEVVVDLVKIKCVDSNQAIGLSVFLILTAILVFLFPTQVIWGRQIRMRLTALLKIIFSVAGPRAKSDTCFGKIAKVTLCHTSITRC